MSDCIDAGQSPCTGETFERYALSGSGLTYPRCDGHYDTYVERTQPRLEEIRKRYPMHAPSDFDESYAGERWDEDY